MPRKFRFTRAKLDALTMPPGKAQAYFYDTECPGLVYLLSRTGAAKFYLYKKLNGIPRRYPIAAGNIPVDDARALVNAELVEFAKGNDQQARRKSDAKQLTLAKMFQRWKSLEGGKRRSTSQYEDTLTRYAGELENRRIDLITQADVATAHARVGEQNGHYAANRFLAVLSIVFKWAAQKYQVVDQTKGVDRFPETIRERFLQPDELVKFFEAIDTEPDPTWKDFWKVLIATGARRGNVAGMAWSEVDLIAKVWRIPAGRAKAKKPIPVPLSDEALAVLRHRKETRTSEQWVFPSHSLSGHLSEPKGAWARLLARAGLNTFTGDQKIRLHDLRRTVGSYMTGAGLSDALVGKVLGHSTAQATTHYAHARTDTVRAALAVGLSAITVARKTAVAEAKAAARKAKKRGKRS